MFDQVVLFNFFFLNATTEIFAHIQELILYYIFFKIWHHRLVTDRPPPPQDTHKETPPPIAIFLLLTQILQNHNSTQTCFLFSFSSVFLESKF